MRWLRSLIDGIACIGSFGQRCGPPRPELVSENPWAAEADYAASHGEVHQAVIDGTLTAEHLERHRAAYDRYLDARTARAR